MPLPFSFQIINLSCETLKYFIFLSIFFDHRSFDEPNWGDFDNNDDVDSVWGFSAKASSYVE